MTLASSGGSIGLPTVGEDSHVDALARCTVSGHTDTSAPVRERNLLPIKKDGADVRSVGVLFFRRRPPNIARNVALAAVNAVKRMAGRRRRANSAQESIKRTGPIAIHCQPSAAVAFVTMRVRICRPLLHHGPRSVFLRVRTSVGAVSGDEMPSVRQALIAAARERCPARQRDAEANAFIPAVATAKPHCAAIAIRHARDNHKPSKALPFKLKRLRHKNPIALT